MESNTNPRQWSSISSSRDSAGEATRMFFTHIRQYVNSLPIVTLAAIILPIFINIVNILTLLGPTHDMYLYNWGYLSLQKIVYHWQVHRLVTYPLVHPSISLLFTNLILFIPYVSTQERSKGSLQLLYELTVLFTVLPSALYLVLVQLGEWSMNVTDTRFEMVGCAGLSVWVVALSLSAMLAEQAQGELSHHRLFGVVPLPSKLVPFLIVIFYLFLVPDSSFILHLCAVSVSYLYFTRKLPSLFIPTSDVYRQYESRPWLRCLCQHPKYISVDAASSSYLPVSTTGIPSTSPINAQQQPSGSAHSFPGQGYTLSSE